MLFISSLVFTSLDLSWTLLVKPKTYQLSIQFIHNESLPIPLEPENCNPFKEGGPDKAEDGLPYLSARENIYVLEGNVRREVVRNLLGFESISMDWMPCGHPPLGVFTTPHYDMHFYYLNETMRDKIGCVEAPPAPVCSIESEPRFFTPLVNNNIRNFKGDANSAVPRSGLHWYDMDTIPSSTDNWKSPITIMGSWDGKLSFWETMTPLNFRGRGISKVDKLEYVNQTEYRLPNSYSVSWSNNNLISIELYGSIEIYEKKMDELKLDCCLWGGWYRPISNGDGECIILSDIIPDDYNCFPHKSSFNYYLLLLIVMILIFTGGFIFSIIYLNRKQNDVIGR